MRNDQWCHDYNDYAKIGRRNTVVPQQKQGSASSSSSSGRRCHKIENTNSTSYLSIRRQRWQMTPSGRALLLLSALLASCATAANMMPSPPSSSRWGSTSSSSNQPTISETPTTAKPNSKLPITAAPSSRKPMQKSLRAFTSSPSETPYTRYLGSTPTPTSTSAAITSGSSTSSVRILAKEVYLTTIISNFYPMDPGVAQTWQDVTTNWVLDYWKKTQRVTKLSVGTLIIKQDPPYSTPGSTKKQRSGQRRVEWQQQMRYLQTPEVTLLFQQTVNYQVPSGITEFPPPESICTEPFATFALRSDYIATLVNASSAFQNITTVSQFKVTDPPPAQPKKPWYALVADQPIILGAVGGGILLCIMVIFTICICRGQKNGGDITINSKQRNEANGNLPNGAGRVDGVAVHGHVPFGRHYSQEQHRRSRDARMDSYIEVRNEKLDDISTLGDPLSPYDKNYLIRQRLNTDASTKTSEQEKTVGPR